MRLSICIYILINLLLAQLPAAASDSDNYAIDSDNSMLWIFVYRSGVLKTFGHDHLISSKDIRGKLTYHLTDPSQTHFEVQIPVHSLKVDDPQQRQMAGEQFSRPVSEQARSGTRQNMLGESILNAEAFPVIGLNGQWQAGDLPDITVDITLGLLGRQHSLRLPIRVERSGRELLVRGEVRLYQSQLGIKPLSAAAGMIKVADQVDIKFDLILLPALTP